MDHARNREFVYESTLERDFLVVSLASPEVVDIHEQPPPVSFVHDDGRVAWHTFDMLLRLRDGRRAATDVKPKGKVVRSGILEVHRLIREQVGAQFADLYLVRTEDHVHPDDVADGELLLKARRLADSDADSTVSRLVGCLHGWCRMSDLVLAAGIGGPAFNAAVRLVGDGVLEVRDRERISLNCFVRRSRA